MASSEISYTGTRQRNHSEHLFTKRKTVQIGCCELPLFLANLFFAFIAVTGQVGQNVSLPLWVDSTNGNVSGPTVDSYFVLSFASLSYVIIFGIGTLIIRFVSPGAIGETEKRFPHRLMFLVGLCDALNGALVVFASKGSRTPPYLQAILGNFMIPLTILFRFVILKKKPTLLKLCCGIAVVIGLFICLIPTIFPGVDAKAQKTENEAHGVSRVLWPIIFMFGFLPAAIMNVLEERGLKMESKTSRKGINVVFFLFWTSTYQFLCVALIFWADILPWYGNVDNISEFGRNWWYGIQCFFGGAGCSATPGIRGAMFILMYVISYVGGANLLRHAEGATWLAIVTSLVTPLGFLFWTLFSESPFKWHPEGHVSTWFSIGALAIMVPAIFVYNMGAPEVTLSSDGAESGGEFFYSSSGQGDDSLGASLIPDASSPKNYSV
ncbi:crt homolog 3-like [Montipora capricornis]|uniref:crt homolog 3-like n=1 Tax=Montipora capricornis TaxID=246305 RepID=UPI0035F16803